jgi:hypothetical protein
MVSPAEPQSERKETQGKKERKEKGVCSIENEKRREQKRDRGNKGKKGNVVYHWLYFSILVFVSHEQTGVMRVNG